MWYVLKPILMCRQRILIKKMKKKQKTFILLETKFGQLFDSKSFCHRLSEQQQA